jgi:hypothetical protein
LRLAAERLELQEDGGQRSVEIAVVERLSPVNGEILLAL